MPPVFTIGHSTRSSGELLELLAEHGIEVLVDVRRYPGSRRHPQFSRDALAAALAGARIEYMHEPDLGGRRAARPDSPHVAWRVDAFRGYADHMETPELQAALERLITLAQERRTVILCAEAVPWRCHRRLISDALVARKVEVRHILGPGRADPHEIDANARVENGGRRLVYSGAPHPPGPPLPSPPTLPGEGGTRRPRGRGRPSPGGMGGDGRGDGGEGPVQGNLFEDA